MKKLITSSLLIICFYVHSNAQSFGFRTGMNISKSKMTFILEDEDFPEQPLQNLYGFYGGVFAEFELSNSIFFETGLYASQKGVKQHIKEDNEDWSFEIKSSLKLIYLEVPILAKVYLPIKKGRFYGSVGPSIGIGVHGKVKASLISPDENEVLEQKVKWGEKEDDHYKRLDISGQLGIGYEINKFQIGIQHNIGFTNILNKYLVEETDASLKNRAFTIYVGYRFYN